MTQTTTTRTTPRPTRETAVVIETINEEPSVVTARPRGPGLAKGQRPLFQPLPLQVAR